MCLVVCNLEGKKTGTTRNSMLFLCGLKSSLVQKIKNSAKLCLNTLVCAPHIVSRDIYNVVHLLQNTVEFR